MESRKRQVFADDEVGDRFRQSQLIDATRTGNNFLFGIYRQRSCRSDQFGPVHMMAEIG